MKSRYSLFILASFFIIILIFLGLYLGRFYFGGEDTGGGYSGYTLPIGERAFYIGIVPTPRNSPNSSFDDLVAAYEEAGEIAEICMVWVERMGIGEYELLKRNRVIEAIRTYGLKPVITLNFATIKRVGGG